MRCTLNICPLSSADRDWVACHIIEHWGAEIVVAHDTIYHVAELPGFVAEMDGEVVGLVTFHNAGDAIAGDAIAGDAIAGDAIAGDTIAGDTIADDACEIVTLNSLRPGQGIGTALIEAVKAAASAAGCLRLWLITTNDNLHALGFYQKRGFRLVAVYPGAVDAARRLKPEIPLVGNGGIPIRDEIELEIVLA
jgi:ribosomal protein S18 acetylase RimI-like enzyme